MLAKLHLFSWQKSSYAWSEVRKLYCAVEFLWLKHRNLSLSRSRVGLKLHLCDWGAGINVYIDNLLPHAPLELGMWSSFSYYCKCRCLQEPREVYKLSTQKAKMLQTKRGKWPRTSPHRWPSLYKISQSTSESLNRLTCTSRVSFCRRYMYMYHPVHVHVHTI